MPQDNDIDLDGLHAAFVDLRARARAVEPGSWWLNQSELTTLGYEAIVREVAATLASDTPSAGPVVLDWGAGPAFTTYLLERLGIDAVYYDLAHDYPSYRFVIDQLTSDKCYVDDPTRLPFDNGSFDAALSCGVLEHVPDPPESLRELHRVLKPGGLLFVYHFPNKLSYTETLAGMIGQANHDVRWTRRRLTQELDRAGFEVVRFDYRYLVPRNLLRFPRLRATISRSAERVYRIDRALTRIPILNAIANSLNVVAQRAG